MTTSNVSSSDTAASIDARESALDQVLAMTLNNAAIQARKEQAISTEFVIDGVALRGDITIFYASPNTGKTLLTLSLLTQTKQVSESSVEIFHVNLDDSFDGLTLKAELGLSGGYRVLDTKRFANPSAALNDIFMTLIEGDAARDTVFVLDTVKKFTDPMDKKASSAFMRGCRAFTQAGGTLILLAHNNKQTPNNPTPTPGGTSDLQDDADCVYVMSTVKQLPHATGTQYLVKFENRKARGPNAVEAYCSFTKGEDADYVAMYYSVRKENTPTTTNTSTILDSAITNSILNLLTAGSLTQTEIIEQLKGVHGKNAVRSHLKALTEGERDGRQISSERGANNSVIYQLIN